MGALTGLGYTQSSNLEQRVVMHMPTFTFREWKRDENQSFETYVSQHLEPGGVEGEVALNFEIDLYGFKFEEVLDIRIYVQKEYNQIPKKHRKYFNNGNFCIASMSSSLLYMRRFKIEFLSIISKNDSLDKPPIRFKVSLISDDKTGFTQPKTITGGIKNFSGRFWALGKYTNKYKFKFSVEVFSEELIENEIKIVTSGKIEIPYVVFKREEDRKKIALTPASE
ncbi:hypothetical protein CDIK_3454 [Cucumispora dikerogammari]|nr:hypothetical protein CDIK_3454 [Cucumispora dikerogammari]